MAEESSGKEETFKFDPTGQSVEYISLEQARVEALRHAREDRRFYGRRYARRNMVWQVVSSEQGEDYYYIRLSYRPSGLFRGQPGTEQFTIDKTGGVALREVITEPVVRRGAGPLLAAGGLTALVAVAVAVLFAAGVLPPRPTVVPGVATSGGTGVTTVPISPVQPSQLVSPDGEVTVDVAQGAVDRPVELSYRRLTSAEAPWMPWVFAPTKKVFDLSIGSGPGSPAGRFSFAKPAVLTIRLSAEDAALSGGKEANVVIQRFGVTEAKWLALPTTVDFAASTARALVDRLSIFALTVKTGLPPPPVTPGPAATRAVTPAPPSPPTALPPPTVVVATVAPPTKAPVPIYTLAVTVNPPNAGTTTGGGTYPAGTRVNVSALPRPGWKLDGWSGDCVGVGTCVVSLDANKSVIARFSESLYKLSVSVEGEGKVFLGPPGGVYRVGAAVKADVVAASGWRFEGWSGACSGRGECVMTMDSNKSLNAVFMPVVISPKLALTGTKTGEAGGNRWSQYNLTVENWSDFPEELFHLSPDLPPCGRDTNASRTWVQVIDAGTNKEVHLFCALASSKQLSLIWFTVPEGTSPPVAVYVNLRDRRSGTVYTSNKVEIPAAAKFIEVLYKLSVTTVGQGRVGLTPAGAVYPPGTKVTAVPGLVPGWKFEGWSGACSGGGACVLTMTSDMSIVAKFTQEQIVPPATLTVSPVSGPPGSKATLKGAGFLAFHSVTEIKIGGLDVGPYPPPATDGNGAFTITFLVPQLPAGTYAVTPRVGNTTAGAAFTVEAKAAPTPPPPAPTPTSTPTPLFSNLLAEDCSLERKYLSLEAKISTSIKFVNRVPYDRIIYWLDYNGRRVLYQILPSLTEYIQPTFVTYPWLVADSAGECLGIYLPTEQPSQVIIRTGAIR